jgi:hypothetical protein
MQMPVQLAVHAQAQPFVLHLWQMSDTITVRLPEDLRRWLKETARRTGLPAGRIIRLQLERARGERDQRPWMSLAGALKGLPRDLSTRKGFSKR